MSDLSNLKPPKGATKNRKRVGRGQGSTLGKTSGRGQKGQNSRSGGGVRPGFEGGQMPLIQRVPKMGFTSRNPTIYSEVNIRDLETLFNEGDEITYEVLTAKGLTRKKDDGVKILGSGELTKKLTIKAHKFSKAALSKIEAAGGTAEVVKRGK